MTDVIDSVKSVGATFSSWDSCMSKAYCKWPVIAAIIVGSLIVLSVLWCVFSCLCCGVSLCAACTRCLTCGGCCGSCGSRGRRRDAEYQAMPPTPTPYQGYQPQPGPMMYANNGPQFATFDAGNKRGGNVHEDSLPPMPSWDTATTRQVEDHSPPPPPPSPPPQRQPQPQRTRNDMEMERMLPYGQGPRSPVHESPYTSDIGAQSQALRGGYNNNDYYDTPMSPAPTYYSTAPAGAPAGFGARAMSPQHTSYDTGYHGTNTPAPYPRESTQYTSSPPPPSAYNQSPYHQEQDSGVRPPSLLQIGRKPVPGTYREV